MKRSRTLELPLALWLQAREHAQDAVKVPEQVVMMLQVAAQLVSMTRQSTNAMKTVPKNADLTRRASETRLSRVGWEGSTVHVNALGMEHVYKSKGKQLAASRMTATSVRE